MRTYELKPTDGRKSFYRKAIVIVEDNGIENLQSYDTTVMRRYPDGKIEKTYDKWSATTGRHIKAFCGMSKKDWGQTSNECCSKF
jgi:hypothetical protein